MAGTLVLTDTIGQTFDDLFADVNEGTDAVRPRRGRLRATTSCGDQRARLDAVARRHRRRRRRRRRGRGPASRATPRSSTRTASRSATRRWARRPSAATGSTDDELNPFDLAEGRAPEADDEVVIDKGSADDGRLRRRRHDHGARPRPARSTCTIVGIATFGDADSPGGATLRAVHPDAAAAPTWPSPGKFDAITVVADDGVSPGASSSSRIAAVVPDRRRGAHRRRDHRRGPGRHQGGPRRSSTPSC